MSVMVSILFFGGFCKHVCYGFISHAIGCVSYSFGELSMPVMSVGCLFPVLES